MKFWSLIEFPSCNILNTSAFHPYPEIHCINVNARTIEFPQGDCIV